MLEVQENEFVYFILFCIVFFFITGSCIFLLIKALLKLFNIKGNLFLICPKCARWGTLQKKNNRMKAYLDTNEIPEILDSSSKKTEDFTYICSKCKHSIRL
jgi:hypothetical protein